MIRCNPRQVRRKYVVNTGVSGNVLIDQDADRFSSYNVWDNAEGQDAYHASMLVDLTQPPDKVGRSPLLSTILHRKIRN